MAVASSGARDDLTGARAQRDVCGVLLRRAHARVENRARARLPFKALHHAVEPRRGEPIGRARRSHPGRRRVVEVPADARQWIPRPLAIDIARRKPLHTRVFRGPPQKLSGWGRDAPATAYACVKLAEGGNERGRKKQAVQRDDMDSQRETGYVCLTHRKRERIDRFDREVDHHCERAASSIVTPARADECQSLDMPRPRLRVELTTTDEPYNDNYYNCVVHVDQVGCVMPFAHDSHRHGERLTQPLLLTQPKGHRPNTAAEMVDQKYAKALRERQRDSLKSTVMSARPPNTHTHTHTAHHTHTHTHSTGLCSCVLPSDGRALTLGVGWRGTVWTSR
jgi:hypothetical protein